MNCQDITRLVDSGKFSALTANEHRSAEVHAHACRHCAPMWMAHAHLAATRAPAMPQELSVRCLTLAAAGSRASTPLHASRRMTFVAAGVLALAAAASLLLMNLGDEPVQQRAEVLDDQPVPALAEPSLLQRVPDPETTTLPVKTVVEKGADNSLPLLPAPAEAPDEIRSGSRLAMLKAVELYPELVDGPEIAGQYVVSLVVRADGTVLLNSIAVAKDSDAVNEQMRKAKPFDGRTQTFMGSAKGARLADGRTLRAGLVLAYSVVPNDYDATRSSLRVEEIVRTSHAHLMLPASAGGVNFLTLLLADDGTIQRESVEFRSTQQFAQTGKPQNAEGRAKEMAHKLGVSADRIGMMGIALMTDEPKSGLASEGRSLVVDYAWTRRASEAGPVSGTGLAAGGAGRGRSAGGGFDTAAALVIVERLMPEVFLQPQPPAGQTAGPPATLPAVVLTAEGRVIGTGIIDARPPDFVRNQSIAPGVVIGVNRTSSLRNRAGTSAQVLFLWEATPQQREALEKARETASDR
jgi:hypothetical protein